MKFVFLAYLALFVCLDGVARDRSLPPPVISQIQVDSWVHKWQGRLALNDWRVAARVVPAWELRPNTLGNLRWNSGAHTAFIQVMSPRDYDLEPDKIASDMEMTVLHELIHLQLSVLPRNAASRDTEEQVVNRMAEAIFRLDNKTPSSPSPSTWQGRLDGRSSSETSRSRMKLR